MDVTQHLREDFRGGLRQVPGEVRRWYTNNFVQRTIAYLMGWKPDGTPAKLQLAADGSLKVSIITLGSYESYESDNGSTTADPADNTIDISLGASRLDLFIASADAWLAFKKPDGTWGDRIYLTAGWHSIDFSMLGFRLSTMSGFGNAFYWTTWYR